MDEIRENTPKCWRTLYHLLDLYSTMPEMKTISRSQLSVIEEEDQSSPLTGHDKFTKGQGHNVESVERQPVLTSATSSQPGSRSPKKPHPIGTFTQSTEDLLEYSLFL